MKCLKCEMPISEKEESYSVKLMGGRFCIQCQRDLDYSFFNATPEERKLFIALLKEGYPAQIQKDDGYKTIDIAIPDAMLNIEVDGRQHIYNPEQRRSDKYRTMYSSEKGYKTVRYSNDRINLDLAAVV